jgi:hypothetical protein
MIKTPYEILTDGCAAYPLRTVIDNLLDEQIIEAFDDYADQFKPKLLAIDKLEGANNDSWFFLYNSNAKGTKWFGGSYTKNQALDFSKSLYITHFMEVVLPEPNI